MGQPELDALERVLGHRFAQRGLLVAALTHSSVAHERNSQPASQPASSASAAAMIPDGNPGQPKRPAEAADGDNDERECLGDAALGLLVAESLYRRYPNLREGDLTRLRANLVSRKHLGDVGAALDLGSYLRLGKGEERSGGRRKSALLANAMEAVFAAIYLDAGLEALRAVVEALVIRPSLPELASALSKGAAMGDHKSALQEYLQSTGAGQPKYVVTGETGPDHRKRFTVELRLQSKPDEPLDSALSLAKAIGSTKKEAQQEAARLGFEALLRERDGNQGVSA